MRYAALILICAPIVLIGTAYAVRTKKRARICLLLSEFLRETARYISETGTDICGTLDYIAGKAKFSPFSFPYDILNGISCGAELETAWKNGCGEDSVLSVLTNEEKAFFSSACECFESSSKDELYNRLLIYAQKLENAADEEKEKFKKNGNAAVGLSFLGAAALFIILV